MYMVQKGSAIWKQVIYSEIRKSPKRTTQKANREASRSQESERRNRRRTTP